MPGFDGRNLLVIIIISGLLLASCSRPDSALSQAIKNYRSNRPGPQLDITTIVCPYIEKYKDINVLTKSLQNEDFKVTRIDDRKQLDNESVVEEYLAQKHGQGGFWSFWGEEWRILVSKKENQLSCVWGRIFTTSI